jgi:hypothetical protein
MGPIVLQSLDPCYIRPPMRRACPHPDCTDGVVVRATGWQPHHERLRGRTQLCPLCGGSGTIDERDEDMRCAGIVAWGVTEEDFRSQPTLTW